MSPGRRRAPQSPAAKLISKPIMNTNNAGVTPDKTQAAGGSATLAFNCSTAVDVGRVIVLSVGQGLSSTSGSAVYGAAPVLRSIAPTDWIGWAGGGKLWRVAR
jgi:hypothetical protein